MRINPITKFRTNLPTEYNPIINIILPLKRPYCWYYIITYIDNNCINIYIIYRPTDSANTPTIITRPNDRADVPIIYQLTNRRALYLTTITT